MTLLIKMFIPLVKNFLFALVYGFFDFAQIAGLYIKTLPFNECFCFLVPIKGGIAIGSLDMYVNRFMLSAVKEKAVSEQIKNFRHGELF